MRISFFPVGHLRAKPLFRGANETLSSGRMWVEVAAAAAGQERSATNINALSL